MKPFYYGKKEKETDAQDDNTLPTLKVSQREQKVNLNQKKKNSDLNSSVVELWC